MSLNEWNECLPESNLTSCHFLFVALQSLTIVSGFDALGMTYQQTIASSCVIGIPIDVSAKAPRDNEHVAHRIILFHFIIVLASIIVPHSYVPSYRYNEHHR